MKLNERQLEIIAKRGLNQSDFEPKTEEVTISDLVDAISILSEIVLGGADDEE